MSKTDPAKRPIIVIKRAAHHDEEHGGNWKVAYADFVTAMMAFFLIMWLLAISTPDERVVIAKYFSSSSVFGLPAGTGVLNGGKSVLEGGDPKSQQIMKEAPNAKPTTNPNDAVPKPADAAATARDRVERQRFEAMKAEMERMAQSGELKQVSNHLALDMTPDGLRIQVFDRDGEAMFMPGGFEPTPRLSLILGVVSQVLNTVNNAVVVTGHTDSQATQHGAYSNWELSADRANSVRRTLEGDGLGDNRMISVEGRSSTEPLLPQTPLDPRNRRVAITILRSEVEAAWRSVNHTDPAAPP
jgi:chemotaxis protein MotB